MLAILIIVVFLAVFFYWLRSSCLSLLRDPHRWRYKKQIASANHLVFPRAKALLGDHEDLVSDAPLEPLAAKTLDALEASLDRDYRVLIYLLENTAADLHSHPQRFVLTIDFLLMRLCYRVLRVISQHLARRVVLEMAVTVEHLAGYAGERLVERRV